MSAPVEHAEARARAIRQFRAWAADQMTLVIDTETTGLDGTVWDFAAVPISSRTPAPVLAFIAGIWPDLDKWSDVALEMATPRLHLIPEYDFSTYSDALDNLFDNYNLLSYNAEFDHARLTYSAERFGHDAFPVFDCIMLAYAPLAGRWSESRSTWKTVTLSEACRLEHVDISDLDQHSAYGGAVAAARLVAAVAARGEEFL